MCGAKEIKSEKNVTKKTQKEKHEKDIDSDSYELNNKESQFESNTNAVSDKIKEIRLTLELIKYLKAEVTNKKEELSLLKKSLKESNQKR
jgi:hypothetical protein